MSKKLVVTGKAPTKENPRKFENVTYDVDLDNLGPYEIFAKIDYCGICHTDFFCFSTPGKIPGHEMVGTVIHLGKKVTNLKIGQKVGLGWQKSACLECKVCKFERTSLCNKRTTFHDKNRGGWADGIVWDSRFAFPLPENLKPELAGPLMCAGGTVYAALVNCIPKDALKKGSMSEKHSKYRVGIIGIGGLGHLALQYANAMGFEVVAISGSSSKSKQAKELGAHEFLDHSNEKQMKEAENTLDYILNTVSGDIDWDKFLNLLAPLGVFVLCGVPENQMKMKSWHFIGRNIIFTGSLVSSQKQTEEMLKFTADKSIKPLVEVFDIDKVEEAVDRVDSNKVRFRAVLKMKK